MTRTRLSGTAEAQIGSEWWLFLEKGIENYGIDGRGAGPRIPAIG